MYLKARRFTPRGPFLPRPQGRCTPFFPHPFLFNKIFLEWCYRYSVVKLCFPLSIISSVRFGSKELNSLRARRGKKRRKFDFFFAGGGFPASFFFVVVVDKIWKIFLSPYLFLSIRTLIPLSCFLFPFLLSDWRSDNHCRTADSLRELGGLSEVASVALEGGDGGKGPFCILLSVVIFKIHSEH